MADTQTEVQVIELEGTRVDTLWTTVESGKLDDGTKYEKRQRTAPRTLEKAIQDENGTLLPTKLTAMQKQLDGVSTEIVDTMNSEITKRAGEDIATKDEIINDNLLKNSNFKLNTNGLSEYGSGVETVNGWKTSLKSSLVVNEDSTVTITASGGTGYLIQTIEVNGSMKGKDITLSLELADGQIFVSTGKMPESITADYKVINIPIDGINIACEVYWLYSTNILKIQFYILDTYSVTPKHIKLELGSIATEYVEPDIEIEKVRCGLGLTKGSAVVLNEISGTSAGFETFMDETNGNFYFCITKWMPNGVFRRYQIEPNIHNIDIFEWDGSTWSKLGAIGSGITHLGNQVYALGTVDNSEMYVNGAMKTIDIRVPIVNYGAVNAPIEINAPTKIQGYTALHTGNSNPIIQSTSAPTDTTYLWYDTNTSKLKSYKDGAWQ